MVRRPEIVSADEAAEGLRQFEQLLQHADLTAPSRKRVLAAISSMRDKLTRLEQHIDPVVLPEAFFDPTEPSLIGYFVALALISQDRHALDGIKPFYGAGVYAIYYTGSAEIYRPISGSETPIYVGKADPPVGATSAQEQETKLFGRLNEHRKNIDKVNGINTADFEYRALAVQSGYQAAAENHLINLFQPIWNNETRILYGIGKHGDAATTRANNKSPWDILHPGRAWAEGNQEKTTIPQIEADVARHFSTSTISRGPKDVLEAFAVNIKKEGGSGRGT